MKIKIIELLVRIANKEEVPKKIKYRNKIWEFIQGDYDYENKDTYLFEYLFTYITTRHFINDEVEVIEENKKIEKLYPIYGSRLIDLGDKDQIKNNKSITYLILILNKMSKKIDELKDEINKMKEGK